MLIRWSESTSLNRRSQRKLSISVSVNSFAPVSPTGSRQTLRIGNPRHSRMPSCATLVAALPGWAVSRIGNPQRWQGHCARPTASRRNSRWPTGATGRRFLGSLELQLWTRIGTMKPVRMRERSTTNFERSTLNVERWTLCRFLESTRSGTESGAPHASPRFSSKTEIDLTEANQANQEAKNSVACERDTASSRSPSCSAFVASCNPTWGFRGHAASADRHCRCTNSSPSQPGEGGQPHEPLTTNE
jgi:hypothetical protein